MRQISFVLRSRCATMVQGLFWGPKGRLAGVSSQLVLHVMVPLQGFISVLTQLGGTTTLTMALRHRPLTTTNRIDEQTSGDEEWKKPP